MIIAAFVTRVPFQVGKIAASESSLTSECVLRDATEDFEATLLGFQP
jgi:hypothetical protein